MVILSQIVVLLNAVDRNPLVCDADFVSQVIDVFVDMGLNSGL